MGYGISWTVVSKMNTITTDETVFEVYVSMSYYPYHFDRIVFDFYSLDNLQDIASLFLRYPIIPDSYRLVSFVTIIDTCFEYTTLIIYDIPMFK